MKLSPLVISLTFFYIFCNFIAFVVSHQNGFTIGDFQEQVDSKFFIYLALVAVITIHIYFLILYFPFLAKLKMRQSIRTPSGKFVRRLSVFILLLQLSYLAFNYAEGVNVAGSEITTNNLIRYLFVAFSPDFLFLVYYGLGRGDKYYKLNTFTYLASNLYRGWLGPVIIVLIVEIFYRYLESGSKLKYYLNSLVIILILFLLSPFLIGLKWLVRSYSRGEQFELVDRFLYTIGLVIDDYGNSLMHAIEIIISRFQTFSNLLLVMKHQESLSQAYVNGGYVSFIMEGLPQMFFAKIFRLDYYTFNSYLADYLSSGSVSYNVQTSWLSWVVLQPYLTPVYFLYTSLLIYFSVYFSKNMNSTPLMFISWLMLLMLMLQGWLAAYIVFLISLIQVYLFRKIFS